MKNPLNVLPVLALLLCAALLAAQETPGREPGSGKPPEPQRGSKLPPRSNDADFFLMQAMQAIEGKADLLLEKGSVNAAIEEFRKVLTMEVPKDGRAYEMKSHMVGRLAKAYADGGRKAEALETVKKLLADAPAGTPAEAEAWLEAGSVYKKTGMADEALKAFDRAIELSQKLAQTRPPVDQPTPGDRPPR